MKRITVEYNIEDRHDEKEALRSLNATDAYLVLWDFSQWLRAQLKHGEYDDSLYALLEKVSEEFCRGMDERGISLDDLT